MEKQESGTLEVLVIEDNPEIRKIVGNIVNALGATPTLAVDGEEGIQRYTEMFNAGVPYAAVITDFRMPNKDGVEVVQEIKGMSPTAPICMVTGDSPSTIESAFDNKKFKADDIAYKPSIIPTIFNFLNYVKENKTSADIPTTPPTNGGQ
ncbi:MAG TPA: response regulator [Candidatus Nanoarchaeia archaeon]|nr:response regulator [Candidatus Nanoarchaeia archaeon]